MFGLDVIARLHTWRNNAPFFHHELFHIYHRQAMGIPEAENEPIYVGLWVEGLATYASKVMNPTASDAELMLDTPAGLAAQCRTEMRQIAAAMLRDLESADPNLSEKYFMLSAKDTSVPRRSGYCVGNLLAERLGRSRSLAELSRLTPTQVLPLLREELRRLAD
jgi:hypothetical protein